MKQKIYQVDAFTDKVFSGNPAAVCIMESWPSVETMQHIAAENNLAETAFVVRGDGGYTIRWFTPRVEVALCGHATLASAYVLFRYYHVAGDHIIFHSLKSGDLRIDKGKDGLLVLDFPADNPRAIDPVSALNEALGSEPEKTYQGKTDFMLVYPDQEAVESLDPDFFKLSKVDARGIIVTAKGRQVDFVSRFFAPRSGIAEDPVTGSAHTTLIPYWSDFLGKKELKAKQLSSRGGELFCEYHGARVKISGKAVPYLCGEIEFP